MADALPTQVSPRIFNEGADRVAYNSVDGNNGTITGVTWTTCVSGSSLSSDGSGNYYVTIHYDPSLDLTDRLTLMAWINTNGSSSSGMPGILSKRWQGPYGLMLINTSGHVQLVLYDTEEVLTLYTDNKSRSGGSRC